jgi:hypothetical protein
VAQALPGQSRDEVCAPFGLPNLLGMVARPNKTIISQHIYEDKVPAGRHDGHIYG